MDSRASLLPLGPLFRGASPGATGGTLGREPRCAFQSMEICSLEYYYIPCILHGSTRIPGIHLPSTENLRKTYGKYEENAGIPPPVTFSRVGNMKYVREKLRNTFFRGFEPTPYCMAAIRCWFKALLISCQRMRMCSNQYILPHGLKKPANCSLLKASKRLTRAKYFDI